VGIIAFCNFFLYKWGWLGGLIGAPEFITRCNKVQVDITAGTSLSSFCSQWCNAMLGGHYRALYDKTKSQKMMASACVHSFLKLWNELHNVQATVVGCQHNFPSH
jgi:hypothetical protein